MIYDFRSETFQQFLIGGGSHVPFSMIHHNMPRFSDYYDETVCMSTDC